MTDEIIGLISKINDTLKDFQRATVDYVVGQYYDANRKKILVADEVGLGKTIVAKGVLIKSLARTYEPGRPFHAIYICSNQVLAQQNLQKLNPFRETAQSFSRLIFLAYRQQASTLPLRLSSLTPSTSFNLTKGVGIKDERAIILKLLHEHLYFRNRENILIRIFRGNYQVGEESWNNLAQYYIDHGHERLRPGLSSLLKQRLEGQDFENWRMPRTANLIGNDQITLWEAIRRLIDRLHRNERLDPLYYSKELVRALRFELTQVCVSFLDADLFILDEFQRFKTLLDGEDDSEAGEIAKEVLQNDDSRVLLLSATPFKSFTTRLEELSYENHFDEFRKLIIFLGGAKGEKIWADIQQDQEAFFQLLRFPKETLAEFDHAKAVKASLEKQLKAVMTRNERMSVANDDDDMLVSGTRDKIKVISADIRNFIAVDQVTEELKELMSHGRFASSTMEFSKSVPFPLSYLRGYKLREVLNSFKEEESVRSILRKNKDSFIDFNKINNYQPLGMVNGEQAYPNGKLRVLAEECFSQNGELLLWIPASKPYYKPFGIFSKSNGYSKIIVFSGWAMVPRAVSSLISYEAERRTIAKEDMSANQEKEKRTYFKDDNKRHPRPLITYPNKEDRLHMTNICLTYPAQIIHKWIEREGIQFDEQSSYQDIRNKMMDLLQRKVDATGFQSKFQKIERPDIRWYWLLPALLDNLGGLKLNMVLMAGQGAVGKGLHYTYFQNFITLVIAGKIDDLGSFPEDLYQVLADILLVSPANVSYRVYKRYFPDEPNVGASAFQTAEAFTTLFNKPESISIIRLSTLNDFYWKQVLEYCASGNIEAMMEEYVYLLKDCENKQSAVDIAVGIENVLSIKTTNVKVDDRTEFYSDRGKEMRCHFAISYGDQKISTEAGSERMVNVREIFNSPFRPFVLTSTSIGQEGLDFHYYCRKIVHWNLPHNPIDLEQREGRINRYKAFVIRQCLAAKVPLNQLITGSDNLWPSLFKVAEATLKKAGDSDMVPFWYLNEGEYKIERFVPIHEFSRDELRFERIKDTLSLYRLTFGQPRQEELLEAFRNAGLTKDEIQLIRKSLLINLSPYNKLPK